MITIGLTGSIGVGKSAALNYFASKHIAVFDADRAVHELYETPELIAWVGATFPGAVQDGKFDRRKLGAIIQAAPEQLKTLEDKLHPLVRAKSYEFIDQQCQKGEPICVLDIPLLYETKRENDFDFIMVVASSAVLQEVRVLARAGMNQMRLDEFLIRQMPQDEKIRRADVTVWNNGTLNDFHRKIDEAIGTLLAKAGRSA